MKDGQIRYRVKIRLRGHPPQTATHERLADARRWGQATEAAIREGRHFKTTEAKKHTLGDMVDRYIRDVLPHREKGREKMAAQLQWWKGQIGSYLLADVTPALIAQERDGLASGITLRGARRSPATVVRYLAALSCVFGIAVREWGWLEDSPMRKVSKPKEPRGRVRFLDQDERDRLLRACKESSNVYLYPVVLIALSTGMRYGEIMNLTWGDVDFGRRRIVLQQTKNGDRRSVPIAGQALAALVELEKRRRIDSILIFPKLRGGNGSKGSKGGSELRDREVLRVQKIQKHAPLRSAWVSALEKAAIDSFRFHDLRHCAASYLAMSGASLNEIAEILGHKTLAMVKRYAHLSDAHTNTVVERMNEKFVGADL